MLRKSDAPAVVPAYVRLVLAGGGALALSGAAVIGMDLRRGLREGVLLLARHPVTAESGTRFQWMAYGEGFAILLLVVLGAGLLGAAFRIGRGAAPRP